MSTLSKILIISAFALCLFSCEDNGRPESGPAPLVVEGFIEEGGNPVVIVAHALDLTVDSLRPEDSVEKWGRVSVFDGDTRYLLSGRINNGYTPSFIFTSTRLRGAMGHTYRLLIETATDTVEATATITPAPRLVRAEAVPVAGNDTLFSIRAYLADIPASSYCKFFTRRMGIEKRSYPTFFGTFTSGQYDPAAGYEVTRGTTYRSAKDDYSHYYRLGDVVDVRICSLEEPVFDFWTVYDRNVSLSANLLFSFTENCPSNLRPLGSRGVQPFGYWAAYGVSSKIITVR